jgi:hypothetical protein
VVAAVTGALSATAAGAIALVIGILLAWGKDAPRTRTVLLIGGSASVAAGIWAQAGGKVATTVNDVSESATKALFGSAVGIVGLVILTFVLVRAFLKGEVDRKTDVASAALPPLAISAGGVVATAVTLISTTVVWGIQHGWAGLGQLAASFGGS